MIALSKQIGGGHYSKLKIQPVEYIMANGLDYLQGNVIKYVTRFRDKHGIQDLDKAIHYLEMLKEQYGRELEAAAVQGMKQAIRAAWPDDAERRMDVVGQNGNDGLHYADMAKRS